MTISTTTAKSRYAGDGSTTSFPTGFKFLDADHVRVVLRAADGSETVWTEGSEYSLTGAGAPGGGTVEVSTSPVDHTPAAGEILMVKLAVPPRQETALPLGGAFPSTAVEAMADLAALRDQQIEEALSRAPKFKETTALAEVVFPEPEAGRLVGWNGTGDALVNLEAIGRWQGDWTTATDYVALDVVRDPATKNVYVCEEAHASDDFGDDVAAGYWSEAINVEGVEAAVTAAEAAQAAAEAAQAGAETAETNAETAQAAAETAETGAGTARTAAEAARDTAQDWAEKSEDVEVISGKYSALHHAAKAAISASNASTSEAHAAASAAAAEQAVGVDPEGAYAAGTTYVLNNGVTYNGSFYRSLQSGNIGNTPDSSPAFWELIVSKGDQGIQGLQGPSGDAVIMLAAGDEVSLVAAGAGALTFRMPHAFALSAVRASLKTASSLGVVTVDINENGTSILSTKLTIDANEKTSVTSATPAVISDANLADDAEITIDVDAAGTNAVGLKVTLIGTPS